MQRLYEQTQSEFTRNRIRAFMTRETVQDMRRRRG